MDEVRGLIGRTPMHVTNVNNRMEGSGDGMVPASDIKVTFQTRRDFMDRLLPNQELRFSDVFYTQSGDTKLNAVYPINMQQTLEHMRVSIYMGRTPTVFEPAKIKGIAMSPVSGGYVDVCCTLQVHTSSDRQSGQLNYLLKSMVDVEIEALTGDMFSDGEEDAGPDTADAA
jgi:hypothetical protein